MSAETVTQERTELEAWAVDLVADWPPLTDEQRDRLSAIIGAGRGGGAR